MSGCTKIIGRRSDLWRFIGSMGGYMNHNLTYVPNPQHRNRTRRKSQWLISLTEEHVCFQTACEKDWVEDETGWGFHFSNAMLDYLGLSQDHTKKVFIAKFVRNHGVWHGYPADHQHNHQDIPTDRIQRSWMDTKVLSRPKIRKIKKGQPCRL